MDDLLFEMFVLQQLLQVLPERHMNVYIYISTKQPNCSTNTGLSDLRNNTGLIIRLHRNANINQMQKGHVV